ncbi:hypothetical protein EW146_g3963 [Bondarzewia mesenterica]|uniref:DUF7770 domain-containing protein n=1 Tax=Bondarzewia mesenterica TaxID=1095465 RepID=A0A4S4LW45_9AGAM|nr:hypothetical protein EW146_g3963 [Bondarzewia mesenterica]
MTDNYTYYLDLVNDADTNRVVETFTFLCSKSITMSGSIMYHWRIYLKLEPSSSSNTMSVELDIVPVKPDGTGLLTGASKQYISSRNEFAAIAFNAAGKPTVNNIVKLLLDKGREKYLWDTSSGSGCRWWSQIVADDFEVEGMIGTGSRDVLAGFMDETAKRDPDRMPTPAPRGTFF